MPLPNRLCVQFNEELVGTPLEDIDPFYQNQRVSLLFLFSISISSILIGRIHVCTVSKKYL